jgi:pimeloyl-ACP methyl ester carboxylesterase
VDSALLDQTLQSELYRTDSGGYAWQLPPMSPASQHIGGLMSAWSPDDYVGIDVPVLATRVEQAEAIVNVLSAAGYPPEDVEVGRRWSRDYDDVSKRRAVDALVAAIPDARVVVLDDVSHGFVMEDPQAVVEVMGEFLDGLELGRN